MKAPVRRLPIVTNNPALTAIAPADLSLVVPYENGALAHWVFGGDDTSLISRVSAHTLTKSGTVSYNARSVVLKGPNGYLQSPLYDLRQMTIIEVMKRPVADGANNFTLFGNFTPGSLSGISMNLTAAGAMSASYAMTTGGGETHSVSVPPTITAGSWFAAGVTMDFNAANVNQKRLGVSVGASYSEDADLGAKGGPNVVSSTVQLRVGHGNQVSGHSVNDREVAEWIVFDRSMSGTEMLEVAYRAQIRQAAFSQNIVF